MYTPQLVSTRSLSHFAWGCISDILSPEDTWGYGNDPSNLGLCDAGGLNNGSAIKHKHDKGTLKAHITSWNAVAQYKLPGLWGFLLSHLNIFLETSNITKTGRNAHCHAWLPLIRLVGWRGPTQGAHCTQQGYYENPWLTWLVLSTLWNMNIICMRSAIVLLLDAMSLVSSMNTVLPKLKAWPWNII